MFHDFGLSVKEFRKDHIQSFITCSFQIFIPVFTLNLLASWWWLPMWKCFSMVQPGHLPQEAAASITHRPRPHAKRAYVPHVGVMQIKEVGFPTSLGFYLTA